MSKKWVSDFIIMIKCSNFFQKYCFSLWLFICLHSSWKIPLILTPSWTKLLAMCTIIVYSPVTSLFDENLFLQYQRLGNRNKFRLTRTNRRRVYVCTLHQGIVLFLFKIGKWSIRRISSKLENMIYWRWRDSIIPFKSIGRDRKAYANGVIRVPGLQFKDPTRHSRSCDVG